MIEFAMIPGFTEVAVSQILRDHFTPSDHIKTPDKLYGRDELLTRIRRAFNSKGRHAFIYGDRGVGKSSLALTAAYIHNSSDSEPIYAACGQHSTFESVLQAIGNKIVGVVSRFEQGGAAPSFSGQFFGTGGSYSPGNPPQANISTPIDLNDAIDIVNYVGEKNSGETVIVIDEFERIIDPIEKSKFAELFKNFPDCDGRIHLIVCGIASTVDELLGAHPSAGRKLETIEVPRLFHDYLWRIITKVSDELSVIIDKEALIRIGMISDGFPHYVHLIGESLIWEMFDDKSEVTQCSKSHYEGAIARALSRSEAIFRSAYDKATQKTKNTEEYEAALWAMADHNDLRRQIGSILTSYERLMLQTDKPRPQWMDRAALNSRLLKLRDFSHGHILIGHGSGWFSFRENVLRGYVRLVAEKKGLQLAKDHHLQ